MSTSLRDQLTKALIEGGLLTKKEFEEALKIQKAEGGALSNILVDLGYISREELMMALSRHMNIPPIDISRYTIDQKLAGLIPAKVARRYKVIPIAKIGDFITIAMADPLNVLAMDEIRGLTGFKISPVIATEDEIGHAIDIHYGEVTHQAIEELIKKMDKEPGKLEMIEAEAVKEVTSSELRRMIEEAPVIKVTNMILSEAIRLNASDILVEPQEKEVSIRYRVDGILQEATKFPPKSMQEMIVSRLKVMATLDIAEHRLPQDGRFIARFKNKSVDFRISVIPSSFGEKVALRVLDKAQVILDLDRLGFELESAKRIKRAASNPHGMILVCGPTGCGKTTTLYSILKYIDKPNMNIVTVEDPVEYQIEGINQVPVGSEKKLNFVSALRSILRQDPDVIMVGEIRDSETVDIAIKSALTGHLVLSTIHTTTASGSVVRLINMGIEPFLIGSSVIAAAAQRLLRRVCPHCREEYSVKGPLADQLKRDGFKDAKKFYRAIDDDDVKVIIFGSEVNLYTGGSRASYLILPVIPPREESGA